jgi:hypothetical protein
MVVLAEVQELFASELGAVVGDDGVRDPKAEREMCLWAIYKYFGD